jgi:signal transduction histidine kinase/DNA-binding response OmpR family regulator/ligand-binding sensor domain-containing protein
MVLTGMFHEFLTPSLVSCPHKGFSSVVAALVFALWLVAGAAAEVHPDYVTRSLTVADGLPVNATNAVRVGPQGNLWIATWDGLARYDGVHIELYRTDTHPDLPSNRLIDLAVDADGVLWLFAENQRIGRLREGRISPLEEEAEQAVGAVLAHRMDQHGQLWLGTSRGVFVGRDGALEPVCHVDESVRIQDLAPGPEQTAFLATMDSGLLRCDAGVVEPVSALRDAPPAMASVHYRDGSIWVIDREGIHRLDDGSRYTLRAWSEGERSGLTWGRIEEAADRLWARTPEGVFSLDDKAVESVLPAESVNDWIPGFSGAGTDGSVWLTHGRSVFFDKQPVASFEHKINGFELAEDGTVWLATNGGGVVQLKRRIARVFADLLPANGRNLYAVAPSPTHPGRIWLGGMRSGLMMIEDGHIRQYPDTGLNADDGSIWTILEDRDGGIWHGGTLLCRRLPDDSCDLAGLPPELVAIDGPGREIRLLMQVRSGSIWIGAGVGLYRHEDGLTQRIEASPAATIRAGLERDDGSIWFGSNGAGLFLWRDGQLYPVSGDSGNSDSKMLIRSLYEDDRGVLWVGTEDQGLLRLEIDGSNGDGAPVITDQRQFGPRHGLWDNVIHYVGEDARGRLWMNSNRGIFWIERERLDQYRSGSDERLPVVGYGEADGLLSREGNGGAHNSGLIDDNGGLWLPGQAGLVHIDTGNVERDERPPLVVIESARFGDDEHRIQPADVRLPADRRDLSVRYGAALFRHGDRARFRYRLNGYDDWNDAEGRREAFYTNLPAGDYQFEVIAASVDGVWSDRPATMQVRVAARYYEQTWFLVGVFVLLILLGMAAWRWRLASIQAQAFQLRHQVAARTADLHREQQATEEALTEVARQAEKLRELDTAKSRFFTNLSHELRTPLTLIVGPADHTLNRLQSLDHTQIEKRLRAIRDNGERLLDLVNQIQELSRLEAGYRPLQTSGGDLAALCRELQARFAPSASQRNIRLSGPSPEATCVCIFDHDAIDKILANLLGNAVRHSPEDSQVSLSLRKVTGGVVLSVADQGPGIPPERIDKVFDRFFTADHEGAGSGIGLALARELAHLHGGDLSVESQVGQGTVFRLVLPLDIESWQAGPPGTAESPTDGAGASSAAALPEDERTTVLVVEDEAGVRDFVIECLEADYRVLAAVNGKNGLEMARRELPDLIISDIMMPELDGVEMARQLASDPTTRALPVILLTARTATDDELEGLESGAVDYLTKPFSPEILNARIRRMLGFARRLREQVRIERADRARIAETDPDEADLTTDLEQQVLTRLDDEHLDVQTLAEALHMSRSRLKRAMNEAGLPPPATYIRSLRLREAASLLERRRGNISEVAYAVGFASVSHFSRRFREHFGVTPSEYSEARQAD